jgi:hypothetical protein
MDYLRYNIVVFNGIARQSPNRVKGPRLVTLTCRCLIDEWFTAQILNGKSRNYVLRGPSPTRKGWVNFAEVLAHIEQEYYPSPIPPADTPVTTEALVTQSGASVTPTGIPVAQEGE